MKALDVSGVRFGRLVGQHREPGNGRHTKWVFLCDCGSTVSIFLDAVRAGRSTSCGCFRTEVLRTRSLVHGHRVGRAASRTIKSYTHAKARCTNPNDEKYPIYGGRGISMSQEWMDSFQQFLTDMGECPAGLTLDRIDVNGNYELGNCRWATPQQQSRNRRDNIWVEHDGRNLILTDFAAEMGVSYKAMHWQMKYRGKTAHQALEHIKGRRTSA